MRISMNKCVFIISLSFIFMSCSYNKIQGDVDFDIVPKEDTLFLSNFFSEGKIIPLAGVLLSFVSEVEITPESIVILGHTEHGDVNFFTKEGSYICSAVRIGRGPSEMLNISDIVYNKYTGTLDVLGNYGQNIYKLDIETGDLISKIDIEKNHIYSARQICPVDSIRYLMYKDTPYVASDDYYCYLFNIAENSVEGSFFKMNEKFAGTVLISQINNVYEYAGNVYFFRMFDNCLYVLENGEMMPCIRYSENEYSIPAKLLNTGYDDLMDFIRICEDSDYIWGHGSMFRYREYLFSSYTYHNKYYTNVMNLDDRTSNSYRFMKDDIVWGISSENDVNPFYMIYSDEERAIFTVEPYELKFLLEKSENISQQFSYNRDIVNSLPIDANPMLVVLW